GQAQHVDAQRLAPLPRGLEVGAAVMPQAEVQRLSRYRLTYHVGVAVELVANGGADEVGPVGVESLLHHEVDMAEVHVAKVDRDLLAVGGPGSQVLHVAHHFTPSHHHPSGW